MKLLTAPIVANNRDHALMWIGFLSEKDACRKGTSVKTGYAETFEGDHRYRGLPFVKAFGFKVFYRG